MHRKIMMTSLVSLCLLSGCGVTVTQSYLKAGLLMEDHVTLAENGSRVIHEDFVGLKIQWLPYFSWTDVKNLFRSDKKE